MHAQLFICKRDRQSVGYIPVIFSNLTSLRESQSIIIYPIFDYCKKFLSRLLYMNTCPITDFPTPSKSAAISAD